MNVKIAGKWENGWDTPLLEYDRWIHPIREFGLQEFYMTPISGIFKQSVKEFNSLEEILTLDENEGYTKVFCDDKADTSLVDFVHPVKAMYVFGRTSSDSLLLKTNNDLSVSIPTLRNSGGFWAHQACSIILYDRYLKERV